MSREEILAQNKEMENRLKVMEARITQLEREGQELGASLASSQQECTEQRLEHQVLLAWKAEKEALIDQTEAVQSGLCEKSSGLENRIAQLNKEQDELKDELSGYEQRVCLSAQIDSLEGELLNKNTELEARLQQEADRADQAERSCSQLQEKSHASSLENATRLEKSLAEAAGPLETKVRELSERMTKKEEDHVRKRVSFLHKQKGLKEQLEASRTAERAATEELPALQKFRKDLKTRTKVLDHLETLKRDNKDLRVQLERETTRCGQLGAANAKLNARLASKQHLGCSEQHLGCSEQHLSRSEQHLSRSNQHLGRSNQHRGSRDQRLERSHQQLEDLLAEWRRRAQETGPTDPHQPNMYWELVYHRSCV
ncbi:unnamed protein product [Lota lota]